jgi:hypothetical protein
MVEDLIARGQLPDQQVADWRERGIAPPMGLRMFTACGIAFDGGPDHDASCSVEED